MTMEYVEISKYFKIIAALLIIVIVGIICVVNIMQIHRFRNGYEKNIRWIFQLLLFKAIYIILTKMNIIPNTYYDTIDIAWFLLYVSYHVFNLKIFYNR